MRNRLSLALSALALSLAGPAMSQTAPTGVSVYDNNNVFVGTILDTNKIWLRLPDGEAWLHVDANGEFQPGGEYFYYKSFDYNTGACIGAPYMETGEIPAKGAFVALPKRANLVSRGFVRYPKPPYEQFDAVARSLPDGKCEAIPAKPITAGRPGAVRLEGFQSPLVIR